mmetsp:Transcript_23594/g.59842  ORF Transcript_23594/g.59842 Transcript_23594/m.59842 type:complete len:640 (+) Transcript_23594:58-1977(+)
MEKAPRGVPRAPPAAQGLPSSPELGCHHLVDVEAALAREELQLQRVAPHLVMNDLDVAVVGELQRGEEEAAHLEALLPRHQLDEGHARRRALGGGLRHARRVGHLGEQLVAVELDVELAALVLRLEQRQQLALPLADARVQHGLRVVRLVQCVELRPVTLLVGGERGATRRRRERETPRELRLRHLRVVPRAAGEVLLPLLPAVLAASKVVVVVGVEGGDPVEAVLGVGAQRLAQRLEVSLHLRVVRGCDVRVPRKVVARSLAHRGAALALRLERGCEVDVLVQPGQALERPALVQQPQLAEQLVREPRHARALGARALLAAAVSVGLLLLARLRGGGGGRHSAMQLRRHLPAVHVALEARAERAERSRRLWRQLPRSAPAQRTHVRDRRRVVGVERCPRARGRRLHLRSLALVARGTTGPELFRVRAAKRRGCERAAVRCRIARAAAVEHVVHVAVVHPALKVGRAAAVVVVVIVVAARVVAAVEGQLAGDHGRRLGAGRRARRAHADEPVARGRGNPVEHRVEHARGGWVVDCRPVVEHQHARVVHARTVHARRARVVAELGAEEQHRRLARDALVAPLVVLQVQIARLGDVVECKELGGNQPRRGRVGVHVALVQRGRLLRRALLLRDAVERLVDQ